MVVAQDTVKLPLIADLYNKGMGGVDLAGQFAPYYRIWRRGVKWWHAVFWWLFNEAVTQAWIVHRHCIEALKEKP